MNRREEILKRIRGQEVLVASFFLAVVSMLFVPPSAEYADYIDVRTLCILASMMAVIGGLSCTGLFERFADRLLDGCGNARRVCAVLILLPFFLSMFITNDVSLLTFVPFALIVLGRSGRMDLAIPVVVLQTAAANLGSVLFPFGNPQNIFICSSFETPLGGFLAVTAPLVAVGTAVLVLLMLRVGNGTLSCATGTSDKTVDSRFACVMAVLFVLCIAAVLRMLPCIPVMIAVMGIILLLRPRILIGLDWGLILTFVFLFIFTGNIACSETVDAVLDGLMSWDPVASSALISQVVSNVPAAVMLSRFTSDWQSLLAGVNIGGFGTPIASMASVISLRIYGGSEGCDKKRYLIFFTAVNMLMLIVLLAASRLLYRGRFDRIGHLLFFLASGLYALRYFRTAWSSSESDHSGVYPPFMYSSYHFTQSSMYCCMSSLSFTTT